MPTDPDEATRLVHLRLVPPHAVERADALALLGLLARPGGAGADSAPWTPVTAEVRADPPQVLLALRIGVTGGSRAAVVDRVRALTGLDSRFSRWFLPADGVVLDPDTCPHPDRPQQEGG